MSLPPNNPYNLSQLPALEPPPRVVPNFIDPYTRGPLLLTLSAVAIGIMYLFVTARFYSKILIQHKLTWDDLTCTIAALGITGIFIGLVFLEQAGMGTHQWNLRASELIRDSFLKPLYILANVLPLVALFTKLSFHIYFLQIFSPKPILRWSIYIGAFVTTAFYIAVTVALFVLSTPGPGLALAEQFSSFFNKKTSPVLDVTFANGYFNIFSDLYILLLPISGVVRLNLPTRRKIGVILIFMTGLLALATSSASLYYRYLVNNTGDSTWNLMPAAYLSILEYTIGIDCSCMPACAVAVRRYLPLFTTFKSHLTSRLRILSARFSPGRSSRSRRFFSLGGNKSTANNQDAEFKADGGKVFVLKNLPEISKGVHQMRMARAFIWGSKTHTTTTMDDEENGIYVSTDIQQLRSGT